MRKGSIYPGACFRHLGLARRGMQQTMKKLSCLVTLVLIASAVSLAVEAQSLARIAGKWNNNDTGENILIEPDALGGWQFWSSDFGQARISTATFQGSNINVEGRGLSCFYY